MWKKSKSSRFRSRKPRASDSALKAKLSLIACVLLAQSGMAAQPAYRADAFVDAIGLNASPFERYVEEGRWKGAGTKYPPEMFFNLGVRHYRTGLRNALTRDDAPARMLEAHKKYGVSAMALLGGSEPPSPARVVAMLKDYDPRVFDLVEGPNEVNNKFPPQDLNLKYQGKTDEAAGSAYMDEVYRAIKADPATAHLGVVMFTAIFSDYALARPHDSFDFANMHSYQGYDVPSSSLRSNIASANNILPDGAETRPFIPTECGYNVEADKSNHTFQTGSLRAQALNIPMLLAEYFRHGIRRTYLFALHNADGYGLIESDQATRRPSWYALKNLIAELTDARWSDGRWFGAEFDPKALLFEMEGEPGTVHSLTLQKASGEYQLLIWNEVINFDSSTHRDIIQPPVPVKVKFATDLQDRATVLTQNDAGGYDSKTAALKDGALMLDVPASVMIVRLAPKTSRSGSPPPAPAKVEGAAGERSATLQWQQPPDAANLAGYFIYRDDQFLKSTEALEFVDESDWLQPGLTYRYAVQAYDRDGNMSPKAISHVTMPAKRPDVVIEEIEAVAGAAGDAITFSARVKNIGDGPTPGKLPVSVTFFVDGAYASFGSVSTLVPGQSEIVEGRSRAWTAAPGRHTLLAVADDVNRVSGEKDEWNNKVEQTFEIGASPRGRIEVAARPFAGRVDLSAEGTLDWVHWGQGEKDAVNRKISDAPGISDLSIFGEGHWDRTIGFGCRVAWSDGAPERAVQGTNDSLWLNGQGHSFRFSVPADEKTRILRVYVGALEGAELQLRARLSNDSGPEYVSTFFNANRNGRLWSPIPGSMNGFYELRFRAASPDQALEVSLELASEPNRFRGQVRLQAATLRLEK